MNIIFYIFALAWLISSLSSGVAIVRLAINVFYVAFLVLILISFRRIKKLIKKENKNEQFTANNVLITANIVVIAF